MDKVEQNLIESFLKKDLLKDDDIECVQKDSHFHKFILEYHNFVLYSFENDKGTTGCIIQRCPDFVKEKEHFYPRNSIKIFWGLEDDQPLIETEKISENVEELFIQTFLIEKFIEHWKNDEKISLFNILNEEKQKENPRYILKNGKWGVYFFDTKENKDMPLTDILNLLN